MRAPVLVTYAPPAPVVNVKRPPAEVVKIGLLEVPMPLVEVEGTDKTRLPAVPTLNDPVEFVIEPPVELPPVFVAKVMVPPLPVEIVPVPKLMPPVPPPAAFTSIVTAPGATLVVESEPPLASVKLFAPVPPVLASIVIRPLPLTAPEMVTPKGEETVKAPTVEAPMVVATELVMAAVLLELLRLMVPLILLDIFVRVMGFDPAVRLSPFPMVRTPV